MTGVTGAHYF